jgi:hypothetical protein
MNKFIVLIFILVSIIACDPVQLVYLNNYTEKDVQLNVELYNEIISTENIEIQISDTIIENSKNLIRHHFKKKISPTTISKYFYSVSIPKQSTNLLGPLRLGFPIKNVQLNGELGTDSISFYVKRSEMKKQLKKGRLHKVNWAFFIYNYK